MRRMTLAAALLLAGALIAHADTDHWVNTLKHPRADPGAAAQADAAYCERKVGPDLNGRPTPVRFKRCMASRGWRLDYTEHTPRVKTWIDPETGLTCHDILGGLGSSCSNF
jgi:hypothetical protein